MDSKGVRVTRGDVQFLRPCVPRSEAVISEWPELDSSQAHGHQVKVWAVRVGRIRPERAQHLSPGPRACVGASAAAPALKGRDKMVARMLSRPFRAESLVGGSLPGPEALGCIVAPVHGECLNLMGMGFR